MITVPEFVVCRVCNGDPRASLHCASCHGSQVSAYSLDGYIVWEPPLNTFAFVFRRLRLMVTTVLHAALAVIVAGCIALFILGIVRSDNLTTLFSSAFWLAGHWYVSMFWFGMLLLCFLIFRLRVYSHEVKTLPHWGDVKHKNTSTQEHENTKISDPNKAQDVSVYFQSAAWVVLEQAHALAEKTGRLEVQPVHVFAAALSSPAGGIFMTRLGMDFEKIKEGLLTRMRAGEVGQPTTPSLEYKKVLLSAYADAMASHRKNVGTIELFLQAFFADQRLQEVFDVAGYPVEHVKHVAEWIRMQELLKEEHDRFVALAALKPKSAMNRAMTARQTPLLNHLSEDLTLLARNGYLAPIVGREQEMEEILRAIESGRRSVILVGENGVGKTALIEAMARRMVEEDVPPELFDRRLVSVHLPQLIAAGDPAMAPDRLLSLLHEVGMSGNIILVLSGIEALVGSGAGGTLDLAEIFGSALDKGLFIAIATTTPLAWTEYLERRSLGPKFVKVSIREMEASEAMPVLLARSGAIEYQNQVFFSYASIEKAVHLAGRYLRESHLPQSALDIAKESAVLARKERGEHTFVSPEDVARVIHDKTNIPVEAVNQDESDKLLNMEARLHKRLIGQEEAVTAVAQAMRRARAEIRESKRPIANFLFLGPTGVGKTECTKALAAEYFGSENAMIRLDMSEYQDQSSITRVIGAPGDQRGGLLTEAIRKNPFSIVLLDELEKAHPDILTLFLQVMDDGRLTDGVGRTIDCTNIVLIATSNAGTSYIQEQVSTGTPLDQIKTALLERELKGTFRPEFLNRFDGIIVFKPLTEDDVTQIAWLMIGSIATRMEQKGVIFKAEDEAVEQLAKLGFDPLFGARPLRRVIQERVENALADLLLKKAVGRRDTVTLMAGGELRVDKATLA
ncbi:ATP-dependent Clp protease ATP-binding subunit [Candidatus Uhrbacteria bacterium]|nr:ATP-dependent Clp protease ATP-binding subunit [Candidatus Uhrbacteria bacterium]